jgi:hypothetical protein
LPKILSKSQHQPQDDIKKEVNSDGEAGSNFSDEDVSLATKRRLRKRKRKRSLADVVVKLEKSEQSPDELDDEAGPDLSCENCDEVFETSQALRAHRRR